MFHESTSRSSDKQLNQPHSISSPTSLVPSIKNIKANKETLLDDAEDDQNEISSDEDSMRNIAQARDSRFSDTKEALNGTDKGLTFFGYPKSIIEHFSKPLSFIQKKDLRRLYISYLKEQFFLNRIPARKVIIESPCDIL